MTKGQFISKCLFGVILSTKKPTKILEFWPESFYSFLGASWKLFGASCRLPYKSYYLPTPQEAQKSYKKFQGRNPFNIFVAILVETMTPKRHFEINWPLEIVRLNIVNDNKYSILTSSFSYLKQFREIIEMRNSKEIIAI